MDAVNDRSKRFKNNDKDDTSAVSVKLMNRLMNSTASSIDSSIVSNSKFLQLFSFPCWFAYCCALLFTRKKHDSFL